MAKTYIDIVKYMVTARFEIRGLVEKPDIIGAVFGQTEGLLGGGLDLRELQKNGKIGRIEIDTSTSESKTFGKLFLPSSLGRVETCILAAAVESVDRVGPFETQFKVDKIEDTRNEKRSKIIMRAKDLLKNLLVTEIPDSREISEIVEADVKSSEVTTYGPESLPSGPDIANSQEVILVEGRADVVTLLKNDIDNCIAIGGALGSIPKTIIELTKSKETTLFVDGDRGGDLIIRSVLNVAEVDFIARAPEGKEVEELTRKDIIKSLRSRVPIDQVLPSLKAQIQEQSPQREQQRRQEQFNNRHRPEPRPMPREGPRPQPQPQQPQRGPPAARQPEVPSPTDISNRMLNRMRPQEPAVEPPRAGIMSIDEMEPRPGGVDAIPTVGREQPAQPQQAGAGEDQRFVTALNELHNTLRGRLYDSSGNMMVEIPVRDLIQTTQDTPGASTIVFDGIITQRLVELANRQGVRSIYGVRASQLTRTFGDMILYTKEQGRL